MAEDSMTPEEKARQNIDRQLKALPHAALRQFAGVSEVLKEKPN